MTALPLAGGAIAFLARWGLLETLPDFFPKGDSAFKLKDETACLRNYTERKFRWLSLGQPGNKFLCGEVN
jgi:hypothetical protein